MSDSSIKLAEELFQRAVDLTPAERTVLLAESCRDDPKLRREVESLLASHDGDTSDFLRTRAAGEDSASGEACGAGDVIADKYQLIHTLGEGGLGVVWLAEQKPPVRRKVALKFIRLGMSSKDVLGRFETERNALGLMNHVNIARVLDAGTASNGQPFFVMEYVRGLPITKFCDQERLTTRQRLALFTDVCSAVQHAHQKGVIHRDLKPSNILVMLNEGQPVPKVIDFGIAKAMDQHLADHTLVTMPGQMLGTPEYMSPEQAEMSEIGVDSTTDIYALGVVLYELLTGTLPFESDTLRGHGLAEMHRVMLEVDPPKPSTRISTLGAATSSICENHRTDARTLHSQLRGDLDWIVMKALMKERTRRYASASEFAADVERFLREEPVLATPPSGFYRMRKFARRNRVAVSLVAVAVIALLTGIIGTTIGMLEARQALGIAKRAQENAERNSRREAAVGEFLLNGIGFDDEDSPDPRQRNVMDMLYRAEANIPTLFPKAGHQLEQAAIRTMLSTIFYLVDESPKAMGQIEAAITLLGGPDGNHPDLLEPLRQLAHLQSLLGPHDAAHRTAARLADVAWRTLPPSELREALAALANLTYEVEERPRPSQVRTVVDATVAAVHNHRGSPLELERVSLALQNIAWSLEDRRRLHQEAQPLNHCVRSVVIERPSWSHRITRMWAGWHILLHAEMGPQRVQVAKEMVKEIEFYPLHNPTRAVMGFAIADTLSHIGLDAKAMQLATATCEALVNIIPRSTHTDFQVDWATRIFGNIMDVYGRAGRMAEAVSTIRRTLEATEVDTTGRRQTAWAWEVARRSACRKVLSDDDHRFLMRIARHGLARRTAQTIHGQLAVVVAQLRIGSVEELEHQRTTLEALVASLDPGPDYDWHLQNAIPVLALVQHRLGDAKAASATVEFARKQREKGRFVGDMFDEAVALVDGK